MIVKHKVKGYRESRKIEVDDRRKRVKISTVREKTDEEPKVKLKLDEAYNEIRFQVNGSTKIAVCVADKCLDVFSIQYALKICSAKCDARVRFFFVYGEVFIKITEGDTQKVYDEIGNLIESDDKCDLSIVFSGTEPCLQKVDKSSKEKRLYNFEGTLLG